jgi:hypothetical protein
MGKGCRTFRSEEMNAVRKETIKRATIARVALLLSSCGILAAQSVTMSPSGYVAVPLGSATQFTATVTGLSSSAVTWSVPGSAAVNGAISPTGLYTAPATAPPNPPEVIATSVANTSVKATQFVYFLAPGPTLTRVAPNPIPVGTSTITITGAGFQKGAVIDYKAGSGSPIQAAATFVNSATLTAGVYFGSATTATIYAVNPGSAPSNSLAVPVGGAPATYALTVVNGTGSGSYAAGTVVNISANAAPSGQVFSSWSGATVASASSPATTITMPTANTTVTATYSTSPSSTYQLTVVDGTGSGSYAAGTVVSISANAAPTGEAFSSWSGATVASATSAATTITMPSANTTVTANYASPVTVAIQPSGYVAIPLGGTQQFTATVTGSSNTAVTWSVGGSAATNGVITAGGLYTGPATAPGNPPQVIATSVANPSFSASQSVYFLSPGPTVSQISPNPLPSGTTTFTVSGSGFQQGATVFASSGNSSSVQLVTTFVNAGALSASSYFNSGTTATFYVKNPGSSASNSVTVQVSGPPQYTLTVVNGSGSGSFTAGAQATIVANAAPAGQAFLNWSGAAVANANSATTTLSMPSANTTVTANFGTPPTTYALTVVSGAGSGNYAAGTVVNIAANTPAGQVFSDWTGAAVANASAASTTLTMPAAATTVTANFVALTYTLTVVNGSGSGTYAAGTPVPITANAAPTGEYFQAWTGPGLANANQPSTTVTMPAANATVTASFYTPTPVPFPVSAHPRLWLTPADVTRLQGWANPSNSVYEAWEGLVGAAIGNYQSAFPGAALTDKSPAPASPYPDLGDVQGYQGILSEENAMILAFQSLIDPSVSHQQAYAQAARNLIMYALGQAALGHQSNAPFRDPQFMTYNRASATGHEWPLVVDWIYNATDSAGAAILTPQDKAIIQQVFLMWSADEEGADTTGGDSPGVHGVYNSLALLPGNQPYRMSSNNYYLAHMRVLTMMSLALDPADDPPVNPQVAPSQNGNTERSYIQDATGAWLYQIWAMMGEPAAVAQAYGVPNNPTGAGFGLASGGLPPEGMLYGESFGYVLGGLLALQTSGFNDQSLSGPQIQMIGSPVWDRYVTGFLSSLTATAQIPASESYLGPVYQMAAYGDLLRNWVSPDFMRPFALLALLDQENGVTTHVNAARWFAVNALEGGAAALTQRISDPWTWGATSSVLYVLLLDPSAAPATDPRPNFPTLFYDAPAGRVVAHSDWTPNGTMFDYRASWVSINHQDGGSGEFGLFRKGEFLTTEMSNYDEGGNGNGSTVTYHNTLGLQNDCSNCSSVNWPQAGIDTSVWSNGGQWMENENAGDPATAMSSGSNYVFAASDLHNLYNRPHGEDYEVNGQWMVTSPIADITQATRSVLWLNNDYIVVYDRATSQDPNLYKKFNISMPSQPTITGNAAAATTPGGQELYVQTLLPANATSSAFDGAADLNPLADLAPMRYIYQVQDPSNPVDSRLLHVVQGADPGAPMTTAAYVQSSSGTAFDGAQFGANEVWFPVSASAPFGGTTLPAPAGVHTVIVTGLTPNTSYGVTIQTGGNGNAIAVSAGGAGATSDSAGVLLIAF